MLEDFQSAEDTSAGETGGTSLNAGRMRGGGGEGLGGKKCCRSVLLIWVGEEAFSSVGKRSGALPAVIFRVSQTEWEFGWGFGGNEVRDLGKGVVEP